MSFPPSPASPQPASPQPAAPQPGASTTDSATDSTTAGSVTGWAPSRPVPGQAPPRTYAATRGEFRTGDVLCFRGRGPESWSIRKLTKSNYSHAGLVYALEGRIFCLEATGIGVHLILMSELVKRYHGGIDYFRVLDVSDDQRHSAIHFAFGQLGKLYDHWGVVRFLWFLVSGQKKRSRERSFWYCSEIVDHAYRQAGAPFSNRQAGYVSPADIAASSRAQFAFRLKRE